MRDLAEAAQRSVPGSTLLFTGEHGTDSRTYRVGFKRILGELKQYYKPEWDLDKGGNELVKYFDKSFTDNMTSILYKIGIVLQQHTLDFDLSVNKNYY